MLKALREWLSWLRDSVKVALARDELAELARLRLALKAAQEELWEMPDVGRVLQWVHMQGEGYSVTAVAPLLEGLRQQRAHLFDLPESVRSCAPHTRCVHVMGLAHQLARAAADVGLNITIERRPLLPLAMGHTGPLVDVWPKRKMAQRESEGDWIEREHGLPEAGEEVDVRMFAGPVANPKHPGFPGKPWETVSHRWPATNVFMCEITGTGRVTHWRRRATAGSAA